MSQGIATSCLAHLFLARHTNGWISELENKLFWLRRWPYSGMWYHVVWYRYHCCRETCCLCHQNKTLTWVWRNGMDKGKGGPEFHVITCPYLYQFFHAHCTLMSWIQRQQVPSECWYVPNHMLSHSRRFFIVTVGIWNLTSSLRLVLVFLFPVCSYTKIVSWMRPHVPHYC